MDGETGTEQPQEESATALYEGGKPFQSPLKN